jgi:hypothetical protein
MVCALAAWKFAKTYTSIKVVIVIFVSPPPPPGLLLASFPRFLFLAACSYIYKNQRFVVYVTVNVKWELYRITVKYVKSGPVPLFNFVRLG